MERRKGERRQKVTLLRRSKVTLRGQDEIGEVINPPIPVLVSAIGTRLGQLMVGHAVRRAKAFISVELKDKDGVWIERYSTATGVRLGDEGNKNGWRLSLDDLNETPPATQKQSPTDPGVKCLSLERVPISEGEVAQYEVWHDTTNNRLYFKGCREVTNEKGVTKQRVCLIPFAFLKKALAEFCLDWD